MAPRSRAVRTDSEESLSWSKTTAGGLGTPCTTSLLTKAKLPLEGWRLMMLEIFTAPCMWEITRTANLVAEPSLNFLRLRRPEAFGRKQLSTSLRVEQMAAIHRAVSSSTTREISTARLPPEELDSAQCTNSSLRKLLEALGRKSHFIASPERPEI